jgi:glutaredoxin
MKTGQKRKTVIITMFIIVLLAGCADSSGDKDVVSYSTSSNVIVYGRDSCSFTTSLKSQLDSEGINYTYQNIDNEDSSDEMWEKVIKTSWYLDGESVGLPVVDVNGTVLTRPLVNEIKNYL